MGNSRCVWWVASTQATEIHIFYHYVAYLFSVGYPGSLEFIPLSNVYANHMRSIKNCKFK